MEKLDVGSGGGEVVDLVDEITHKFGTETARGGGLELGGANGHADVEIGGGATIRDDVGRLCRQEWCVCRGGGGGGGGVKGKKGTGRGSWLVSWGWCTPREIRTDDGNRELSAVRHRRLVAVAIEEINMRGFLGETTLGMAMREARRLGSRDRR